MRTIPVHARVLRALILILFAVIARPTVDALAEVALWLVGSWNAGASVEAPERLAFANFVFYNRTEKNESLYMKLNVAHRIARVLKQRLFPNR